MVMKYEFSLYTFSDRSRATNVVQNYFCQEIFLHIKFRLSVTNFFIIKCLFSCRVVLAKQKFRLFHFQYVSIFFLPFQFL